MAAKPGKGRGFASQMARAMGLSSTMLSQVLNGDKNLNHEHATDLAEFLSLNDKETDFLFLLIDLERAGTHKLRVRLKKKMEEEQKKAAQLANRLPIDKELSPETRSVFYSSWMYTGIRSLTALKEFQDTEKISERLQIPKHLVVQILDFLIQEGLLVQHEGQFETGPRRTHLPATHPLVNQHHRNWRIKGVEQMENRSEENLFLTAPLSCSKEVADQIRKKIPGFIEEIFKLVAPSDSELVRCLNIDYFEY